MATGTSAIQRTRWGLLRLALITTVGILIGLLLLYTVEPFYGGHHWDPGGCPVERGAPTSEVDLYTALCVWDCRQCPH